MKKLFSCRLAKLKIYLFLATISLSSITEKTSAQSKSKKAISSVKSNIENRDDTGTPKQSLKIQVPFAGDTVQEVSPSVFLAKDQLPKSQFETETEFLSRLGKTLQTIKFKNKTLNDVVFSFAPYRKYDPEKKEYTIYIGEIQALPGLMNYEDPQRRGLRLVINREKPLGSVVGRYIEVGGANVLVAMPASEAKEADQHLRIAIYGLPVASLTNDMFNFYITKVVVFNNKTGEVYKEVLGKNIKYSEYSFK